MQPPMKTSKTLFFLLGALLAALLTWWLAGDKQAAAGTSAVGMPAAGISAARSEERRVGKECRSRWSPYH